MNIMIGNHSLSVQLLNIIHNKGIFTLHDSYVAQNNNIVLHEWKIVEVLGLEGVYATDEWDTYINLR